MVGGRLLSPTHRLLAPALPQEFSMNGMANILAREGAVMHGIAHLVTPQVRPAPRLRRGCAAAALVRTSGLAGSWHPGMRRASDYRLSRPLSSRRQAVPAQAHPSTPPANQTCTHTHMRPRPPPPPDVWRARQDRVGL